ncbi:MAG: YcxB family protein [Ruminococcaceae bacterium]|nr:YcxB family protein [Oscillospiraceae bacterium]
MIEFKNTTTLSKSDITEINSHIYLKTPLYIVLYIICILSIGARLVDYFFYNVVNLSATIPFLLALIAMVFVFITNNRNMYRQSLDDNGNSIQYNYSLEDGALKLRTSDGKSGEMPKNMIYKSFETKNCFAVRSRENSFFIIKKNGFSEGDADALRDFLK